MSTGGTGGAPPVLDDNGTVCSDSSTCKSGKCVDGVCCNTACTGTCQACNVSGKQGTCTPYASGTDPDSECLGKANSGTACAGTCDGKSACTYPTATTSCGNPMCAAGKQTTYGCGGDGSCSPKQTSCGNYTCNSGNTACEATCTSDAQCIATAYCNGSRKCVPKLANGGSCSGNSACTSSHCISNVCCQQSACAAPSSCGTGTCRCNGKICGSGHSCITWYLDQDDDGYGASSSYDKIACDNDPPSDLTTHSYVKTNDDCDDTDKNVHPGQTAWFTSPSNGGTWDYNCDTTVQHEYYEGIIVGTDVCKDCGGKLCFNGLTPYGYVCSGSGCSGVTKKYKATIGCGQADYLYTCSSGGETKSSSKVTNRCR